MKKLLVSALIGLASTAALADHHNAVSLEGVKYKATASLMGESAKETFDGFAIGYENSANPVGWGVKAELLDADYVDLSSVAVYAHKDLWANDKAYVKGSIGAGLSYLELDGIDVSQGSFILPINLEAGVNVAKNVAVYGTVGYRWDWGFEDTTVDFGDESVKIDAIDLDGVNYKLGVKYKF